MCIFLRNISKLYKYNTAVKVHDLVDETGNASGTKIIITIPVNRILSPEDLS